MPTGLNVHHRIDVVVDAGTPPAVRTPDVVVVRAGAHEPTVPEDEYEGPTMTDRIRTEVPFAPDIDLAALDY